MPPDLAERVLKSPRYRATDDSRDVAAFVTRSGLLAAGERFRAGLDDSWTGSARKGRVLTDLRLFRYRDEIAEDVVRMDAVTEVVVRRIWYPGAGPLGRGEAGGRGPVVILYVRFVLASGRTVRVRMQALAGALVPFLDALDDLFGERVRIAPTLPGI